MTKQDLYKNVSIYTFENAIQRTQSNVIEEDQKGYQQSICLSDLVEKDCKDKRGTFIIKVEFIPNDR